MREIDVPVLESQAEQIECTDMFAAARGGNRAGKSIGFAYWLEFQRLQEYPLAVHAVAGVDYDNLRRGFFPLMCGVLDSLGWEEGTDFRYIASGAPRIFLPFLHPRAKLHSISVKLIERLKGTSIQTLLLEEPQTWGTKEMSGKRLYEILITRLSHSQITRKLYPDLEPQLRMSFNPPSEGSWLHQLIEEQWKKSGFKCWRMSVRDNALLLDVDPLYVQRLETNMDPRRHAAEIDGHWAVGGGGVYYAFDAKVHGAPPPGIPAVDAVDYATPLCWTHDFNVAMMCSLIGQKWEQPKTLVQVNPEDPVTYTVPVPTWQQKILRVLDEFALEDSSSPQVLEAFLKSKWLRIALDIQEQTGIGVELYGDPSGGTRSQTSDARGADRTNILTLANGLRAAGVKVKMCVARAHPPVKSRVNEVNAQFITKAGPGCTIDIERCPVFVADLRELNWASNGFDLAKIAGKIGDASDAYGYWACQERKPASTWSFAIAKKH